MEKCPHGTREERAHNNLKLKAVQAEALAQGQKAVKAGCSRNRVDRAVRKNGLGTVAANLQGGHMAYGGILRANYGHRRC